jgi:hypothetical protein
MWSICPFGALCPPNLAAASHSRHILSFCNMDALPRSVHSKQTEWTLINRVYGILWPITLSSPHDPIGTVLQLFANGLTCGMMTL